MAEADMEEFLHQRRFDAIRRVCVVEADEDGPTGKWNRYAGKPRFGFPAQMVDELLGDERAAERAHLRFRQQRKGKLRLERVGVRYPERFPQP
jgi:hypothetical protein